MPSRDDDLARRLQNLREKVADTQAKQGQPVTKTTRDYSGFGIAMRLGSEFVAGVIVGAGIGWGFDTLLGTTPWGLIVFVLLGFVAGMMNMVRAGRAMDAAREANDEVNKRTP